MSHRTPLARITLDNGSDLVVSVDADGAADLRLRMQKHRCHDPL